jgi:chorismate mutase
MVLAVRGAIGLERNDGSLIRDGVKKLLRQLVSSNSIDEDDIVSIQFSQTRDLTDANPASALREVGYAGVPLFCSQEPDYKGSMPRVIRVLITFNASEKRPVVPVYLDGAQALRSDIFNG